MSLILGNAELKEGPITLRLTHATVSSEMGHAFSPLETSLCETVSEGCWGVKLRQEGDSEVWGIHKSDGILRKPWKQWTQATNRTQQQRSEVCLILSASFRGRQLDGALYVSEWKCRLLSRIWLFGDPPKTLVHQAPLSQNSPAKNTGVGSHSLRHSTFPTQGLNPGLLHCRHFLYHLSHQGSPDVCCKDVN